MARLSENASVIAGGIAGVPVAYYAYTNPEAWAIPFMVSFGSIGVGIALGMTSTGPMGLQDDVALGLMSFGSVGSLGLIGKAVA